MNKAFTLMELMFVISMLSIVSLLFISYSGDVGSVSVDALSRKIQADIRYAQQLATTTGTTHGVQFVLNGNYVVYSGSPSTPVTDPHSRQPMIEDLEEFGEIEVNTNYQVEFDKLGTPTMGGGGNVEVLADSGASRKIFIIDNTGAVVVDVLNYGSGCGCRFCAEAK